MKTVFQKFNQELLAGIEAKFKTTSSKESVIYQPREYESISTGSKALDEVINPNKPMGLMVKRRITEVFGLESCLSGDTFLQYKVSHINGGVCLKGGTFKELYKQYHKKTWDKTYTITCLEEAKGSLYQNKILDVVKTGSKKCYKVVSTFGNEVISTMEHKFYIGEGRYKKLEDLKVGDVVIRETVFLTTPTKIKTIEYVGERETYDLKMEAPNHNYIAQGFVVHNCGKSTLLYQSASNAIKEGWVGALIDAEHSWDKGYGKALGLVEGDNFKVFQPITGEDTEMLINALFGLNKGNHKTTINLDFLMIDSVTAVTTMELLESEDSTGKGSAKGSHARFWNNLIKKLNKIAIEFNCAIMLVNQVRDVINMGSMYQEKSISTDNQLGAGFNSDNTKTTTGGRGIKFYCSVRLLLQQTKRAKITVNQHGKEVEMKTKLNYIKADIVKNKIGVPFGTTKLAIVFGKGFDDRLPMFDYLKDTCKAITFKGGYKLVDIHGEVVLEAKGLSNFQKTLFTKKREELDRVFLEYRKQAFNEIYDVDEDDILEDILEDEALEVVVVEEKTTKPKTTKKKKDA